MSPYMRDVPVRSHLSAHLYGSLVPAASHARPTSRVLHFRAALYKHLITRSCKQPERRSLLIALPREVAKLQEYAAYSAFIAHCDARY